MGQLAVLGSAKQPSGPWSPKNPPVQVLRFQPLLLAQSGESHRLLGTPLTASFFTHSVLIIAVVLAPLLVGEPPFPDPAGAVRAFFVEPQPAAAPPPPPPPARVRRAKRPRPTARVVREAQKVAPTFVAPIAVPEELPLEDASDFGSEFGVEGGVEGGVPGGVIGGVVGGLPETPPPPTAQLVRVGGSIKAPRLLKRVPPVYPKLAVQARIKGIVILEAHVDERGLVKNAKVLRGAPLLDAAAIAAVEQWRYAPLLLNGRPTQFLLTVIVHFEIESAPRG